VITRPNERAPFLGGSSALLFIGAVVAVGVIVHCGGDGSPTPPSSVTTTLAPTTTTTTTLLPNGMVCSPTPPPIYGMQLKIHGGEPGRYILDSKPIVLNIDNYCDRVVGTSGKFCETRLEGDLQRVACDYMVVGQADNGRWGPNWYWNNKPCGEQNAENCNNHATEQFLAIAKATGRYEACASDKVPVAPDGSRCGFFDVR
jgi:hypothetical protein